MIKKIAAFAAEYNMLNKSDKIIAGVSGGADSVCLLLTLLELQKSIGFELVSVHINHGLRGENALRDERYVENLCRQYDVPLEIYREDVELFAKMRKQSLEEAGRNVRRSAFRDALSKYSGTKIALAHHKNDNAETMLMNLARGSGLAGLTGIRPVSGNMIRPLLCVTREEIEIFLKKKNIEYCTDETNESYAYTRNRVRGHILPLIEEEVNEKAVSHMADTAEQLGKIWEYMEERTKEYYKIAVKEEQEELFVSEKAYDGIPEVFRGNLWKEAIKKMSGKEQDIHRAHMKSLEELMEKQTGRQTDLPYRLVAKRCYGGVRISFQEVREKNLEWVEMDFPGEVSVAGMHLESEILESSISPAEKVYTKYFDYDIIKRTVTIRTRRPGDYITIDKGGRKQKLKSYFINEKIPQEERDKILLLTEGSHVLWVIGHRRGYAFRVRPDTEKIVKISIHKGEIKNGREN